MARYHEDCVLFDNSETKIVASNMKEAYEYIKSKNFPEIEVVRLNYDGRIYVMFSVDHFWADDFCGSLEYVKEFLNNLGYDYSIVYSKKEKGNENGKIS